MPVPSPDELRARLQLYVGEFAELVRLGAGKDTLLNGDRARHGLNHITDTWMLLHDSKPSGEFEIKEVS